MWKEISIELSELLGEALLTFACQKRIVFGCPVYIANSNMFAGVHRHSIFIRLSEQGRKDIRTSYADAVTFEPVKGRIMKEYTVLPETLYNDAKALQEWLNRSYQYALSLFPKEPKYHIRKRNKQRQPR